ncbi:MAG: translocation/assembly module TamB, partial [Gemmatimonadota bacterium]|nr:translocation/assembly module TamB [Gemmatimonadota bacterium]
ALAGSRLSALSGTYHLAERGDVSEGDMWLRVRGDTLALADLRWLYPRLPSRGGGAIGEFAVLIGRDSSDYTARQASITSDDASLAGDFGLAMSDSTRFHDTDLRFSGIDTRLIEQLVPGLELPRRGMLAGRGKLAGTFAALRLDADVAFDDAAGGRGGGTSRVAAVGELGFGDDGFRARALRVRAYPVQVSLARVALPDFPLAGTVTGTATLDGSSERWLVGSADLVHRDRGGVSHLTGRAEIGLGTRQMMDVQVRASPLSLVTIGRFAPAAGLHGVARGRFRARGPFRDLALLGDVRFPDGGALIATGRLDIASAEIGYDLTTRMRLFDARSVLARAPRTSLTALASAHGRGFDPATMRATFAVDLSRSDVDNIGVDSVHARVAIADGLATLDSLSLRTSFARVAAHGTFGTTAGNDGELSYVVEVDSLSGLNRWIPGLVDTSVVAPRRGRVARAVRQAREDSAVVVRQTEVERMAMGTAPPRLEVDSLPGIRRDSISGSFYAAGTLRGSVACFDVRGRAAAEDIVARGSSVQGARMEYAVTDIATPRIRLALGATLDSIQAAGFALDSVDLRVAYGRPGGRMELAIRQDEDRDYVLKADFALTLPHRDIVINDLRLRFDTTTWAAVRPAVLHFDEDGPAVDSLDLRSGENGRIFADGRIPSTGPLAVDLNVAGFEIAHIITLLQTDIEATGLVSVTGRLEGTREAPRLRAAAGVVNASYRGTALPDARTTVEYADESLVAHAELLRGTGRRLARADANVSVNLALAGVTGPRFPDRPLAIDIVADSLPLDALPKFTDVVSEIRGRVIGQVAIRGTTSSPEAVGVLELDLGSVRVVAPGVRLVDVNGALRIEGDVVTIDSLVARSGDGTIRARGTIDIADVARPTFELGVAADNALILDNELGRVFADAGIDIIGPFDSVLVAGGARVLRGVVYIPQPDQRTAISPGDPAVFNVIDTSVVSDRELLPGQSPLVGNLRVDINVRINRGTFARSNEGNIEVFTPEDAGGLNIAVDRRRDALTVDGMLATERGEYTVASRRFTISRGSVMFIGSPELNPLIQLIGEREIQFPGREALIIRVIIGGTARHPRVSLESNAQPPISQSDLLSYLAFGRSSSSLLDTQGSSLSGQANSSGGLVGNVAALATRQLAAVALGTIVQEVQADAARSLNADVFNISPAPLPVEIYRGSGIGEFVRGTEIEAGKYINTRTFLAAQIRPSTDAVPGLRMEHRMRGGFRIESSFEPRYQVREPSFSTSDQPPSATGVFGAFLILERRF